MHLGIDFDNTIVCYDGLFHRVCVEKGLIPPEIPVNKSEVRNYLRRVGREEAWTEMQGCVYGARMAEASPYPGVLEFIADCRKKKISVSIISHKTRHPFLGPQYNLHEAAQNWLELQGFFDDQRLGLPRENVFFELTREEKIERIRSSGATHFIDDLPEVLTAPGFPAQVKRILFDPNEVYAEEKQFPRLKSWTEIPALLA